MPRRRDWRSDNTDVDFDQLNRADFAWEFLRRNPQYRRDYNQISKKIAGSALAAEAVGQRWGLCFRLRPPTDDASCPGDLAARACPSQRHPCPGAA